jgi:hypothetical protein
MPPGVHMFTTAELVIVGLLLFVVCLLLRKPK